MEDINISKEKSEFWYKATIRAKSESCLYCGEIVNSFCKSHSIPRFILKNISSNGYVHNTWSFKEKKLRKDLDGINNSGVFKNICNNCDSKIFQQYENPLNYGSVIQNNLLAEIALKNYSYNIWKCNLIKQIYMMLYEQNKLPYDFYTAKIEIIEYDLMQYTIGFEKAKKVIHKNQCDEYYMFFYQSLDYVVPIAFQGTVILTKDLDGKQVNDIYYLSKDYYMQSLHICVFPLQNSSSVFMFVDKNHKRYRSFYKSFSKLTLIDKLAAINYILFSYSEEIYLSNNIDADIFNNIEIKNLTKMDTLIGTEEEINRTKRENIDFKNFNTYPNLLDKSFSL